MAFYKNVQGKTRQQKRAEAFARGGFDDEGANYGRKDGRTARPEGGRVGAKGGHAGHPQSGKADKPYRDNQSAHGGYRDNQLTRGSYRDNQSARGGYRDNQSAHGATHGNRAPMGHAAPRPEKRSDDFHFSPAPQKRFYDEPRRARMDDDDRRFRYDSPARYGVPLDDEGDVVPNENLLTGRNPIREALKSGRDIEKLLVARGELSGSAREIVQMAKERRIPVQEVDRARLDAITRNHQGMLAFASAYQYSTVEHMLELAQERGEAPFLVLLDGITDPHNLGAIIRSAECAGAHGVIVQERRAVGLTPAAVKASAGAVEYLPVARVTNLSNTIEVLKAQNIWVYAADMDGEDYARVDLGGPIALVIGAEGEGVSRRVLESCDKTVSLPIRGKVNSLNASVAAGVLLYAAMRAR